MSEKAHRESKQPRTILAGPYGHPVHSILVTIPIGGWIASFVFDLISLFADDPEPFVQGARVLIVIGLIGAVLAAVAGLLDFSRLTPGTHVRRVALTHMVLNVTAMVLFIVGFVLRSQTDDVSVPGIVLSAIALVGLSLSGFLGGELAYRYGVRVADEDTQRAGFEKVR
jgi:uncharacterized membrane protein